MKIEAVELQSYTAVSDSIEAISVMLENEIRDSFSIPDSESLERYRYFVDCGAMRKRKVNGKDEVYISVHFGLDSTRMKGERPEGIPDFVPIPVDDTYGTEYVATVSLRAGDLVLSKYEK